MAQCTVHSGSSLLETVGRRTLIVCPANEGTATGHRYACGGGLGRAYGNKVARAANFKAIRGLRRTGQHNSATAESSRLAENSRPSVSRNVRVCDRRHAVTKVKMMKVVYPEIGGRAAGFWVKCLGVLNSQRKRVIRTGNTISSPVTHGKRVQKDVGR